MIKFLRSIFLLAITWAILLQGSAYALEMVRQKNVASYVVFPLVDADGDPVTGATSPDSEIDAYADGAAPDGFADCTNEATEIGATGNYYLSLTNTELNQDYLIIQIKSGTAKTQVVLIRTIVGDPLNIATTDDGGTINVTGGAVDTVTTTGTATAVTTVNGIASGAITATAIATDAIGAAEIAADAIAAAEIADGAIDAATLATDTITAAKIAADAITNSELATDAIGAAELAADAIGAAEIAADAIGAAEIANSTIDAATFAAGAIDAAAIAAAAITSSEFAQSAADLVWGTAARTITGGTITTNSDKTGYALTTLESSVQHSGTAQAGAAGTITLAAGASATDDIYKGQIVKIYGGTGAAQSRTITGYVGSTKVATVAWNWTTTPSTDSTYAVIATAHPALNSSLQVATTASDPWSTALPGSYGAGTAGKIIGDNLNATVSSRSSHTAADVWAAGTRTLTALDEDSTTLDLDATTIGTATNVTTVNGIAASAITAAAIATDAIGAAEIAADAIGAAEVANATIDAATFASGAIDATAIATDAVGAAEIATDAIGAAEIAAAAITSSEAANLDAAVSSRLASASITLSGGAVTVGTNNDKTGYTLTAAGIDLIWDEAQSGHTTAGTFGKYLDAQVSTVGGGSAASIADAVWDEVLSGHLTAGTTGNALNAAGAAGDPWSTSIPGSYTGSQAGYYLQDLIKKSRGR